MPAVPNVIGALVAPEEITPVSKPLPVAVWAVLSPLRHATVCPAATLTGLGVYELPPFMPVIVIVTSAAPPAPVYGGVGVGVGLGPVLLLPPHDAAATATHATKAAVIKAPFRDLI